MSMRLSWSVAVVAGATCWSAAFAQPATSQEWLDAVRTAVGYGRVAENAGGLRATGAASIAGIDSSYELIFSGDRAIVQRIEGPIRTAAAIDGDHVWITDIGGETRTVTHSDRESSELSLLVMSYGYLGGASPLRFEASEADSTPEHAALRFTRDGGSSSGVLLIDRATSLPTEWRYSVGDTQSTLTLSEYKEFGGVRFPGVLTTTTDAGFAVQVRINEFGPAPAFVRSPYEAPRSDDDVVFDDQVGPELEVVRAPTGHLLVHPRINGQDVGWFIFDTGAGNSVISTPVMQEMGLESFGQVPAKGVGGVSMSSFCRPDSLTLGAITMREPLMVAIDLSFLEVHMGRKIAGLIGYNLLARSVVSIDMAEPAISLYAPGGFQEEGVTWTPLIIDQRLPHVEASFEGHTGLFKLDTGAAQMSVSLHEPAVRELKLLEGRAVTDSVSGGVGGMIAVKRGELAWFELGGRRTENVRAEFAIEAKGAFADPYSLGNIGGKLLRPFVIVTDYRNARIAFIPRENP